MKKTLARFALALLALALIAPVSLADGEQQVASASGKIVTVDAEHNVLKIEIEGEKAIAFEISESTKITRDGAPVALEKIQVGEMAEITYAKGGEKNTARSVALKAA